VHDEPDRCEGDFALAGRFRTKMRRIPEPAQGERAVALEDEAIAELHLDPRAKRTREAILNAFVGLALERRYDAIRTTDLIAAAGVGRSTFYEHFRSKDDVLVAAMDPILLPLAGAVTGRASPAYLRSALDHVWQQRAFA
jgi:AcrR family transcriptional regulator